MPMRVQGMQPGSRGCRLVDLQCTLLCLSGQRMPLLRLLLPLPQVLLKPGAAFQLREFHACIARVTAAPPSNAADGKTLGEQQQRQQ
jgi:hypothetical protein